jgi:hypothetical protein
MRPATLFALTALATTRAFAGNTATNSATINVSGPRPGGAYLNAEGAGTGKYESFGVVDFGLMKATAGHKLKLTLVQSNAAFTKDGPIKFFICDGSAPVSSLKFNDKKPVTFGAESMHLISLGSTSFKMGAAKTDSFSFPLTSAIQKLLKTSKNVRVVIEPAAPSVAATYAGFQHKTAKHPMLEIIP